MDYESYLNLDELLDTTKPVSDAPLETMFIVAHQSSELWFKVLIQELSRLVAVPETEHPSYDPTIQLQRIVKIFEHLNSLWDIIATMQPEEYGEFRDKLGSASAMQSKQYIKVELLLTKLPKRWNFKCKHQLLDIEIAFKKWQFSHMKTVERIIGNDKGTGGTSGVPYLKHAIDRPLFEQYEWKGW